MIFKGGFSTILKEISLSKSQRNFLFFVLISFVLYPVLNSFSNINDWLTHGITSASRHFIGALSGNTPTGFYNIANKTYHVFDSRGHILIGDPCNGFELYYVCTAFILAIPGISVMRKLVFSIGGILVLFFANVTRVSALFYIAKSHPEWFETFHKTVFQLGVYIIMFIIWVIYLKPLHGAISQRK
jgi:exosortase/archaeosortase family protein